MKRLFCLLSLLLPSCVFGQTFGYGVDFDYHFDNAESKIAHLGDNILPSCTVHLVDITPKLFLNLPSSENISHRLSLGVDIFKNMGEGFENLKLFREITLNYGIEAATANGGVFSATAGCFPRDFSEGRYPLYLFNTTIRHTDRNFEGMFFKYRTERFYAELGLDWLGKFGDKEHPDRRERFQILSWGKWNFTEHLYFGWSGRFYHFACSPNNFDNVVDNHSIQPFLGFENWGLSLNVGPVITYQRDRKFNRHHISPKGFYSEQSFKKWNVGFENVFYCGQDLMPYMEKYGTDLYMGYGAFHTMTDQASAYDILDLVYEPRITENLYLRVFLEFHFGSPNPAYGVPFYRGWSQGVTLKYKICGPKKK